VRKTFALLFFVSSLPLTAAADPDPSPPQEDNEYRSVYGLGPASSQVYHRTRGLSIGGYAEFFVEREVKDRIPGRDFNTADFARYVQYVGYRFDEHFVFNAAVALEHASTAANWTGQGGTVQLEYGWLDLLVHPAVNFRAGLLLMPVGLLNELREPLSFHGVLRPAVEQIIIPTTWSELGVGIFGDFLPGLSYKLYITGGLNGRNFTEEGWRGGRQGGNQPLGESAALTFRLDYRLREILQVGFSLFYGGAGQGFSSPALPSDQSTRTLLFEGHVALRLRGFELKALAAYGTLSGARELTLSLPSGAGLLGSDLYGWYVEAAYDLWPLFSTRKLYLAPFFRFERYNTQSGVPDVPGLTANANLDTSILEAGVSFRPHRQIVIKASYRDTYSTGGAKIPDAWFLGAGFIY
jgi:hypothetical protein